MADIVTTRNTHAIKEIEATHSESMQGFSLVVCCYNSRSRLGATLEHLAALDTMQLRCELVIVDNNSKDDTADFASSRWQSLGQPYPLIIINETKQGLIHAREAGLRMTSNDLVVFVDDDNWLSRDYLHKAAESFMAYPSLGLLGGYANPVSEAGFPDWFIQYQAIYACGHQWHRTDFLTGIHFLWGAGLVSRRSLLLKVFDPQAPFMLPGRTGNQLSSGDDDEINGRVWLLGYDTLYRFDLELQHFIAEHRLNKNYCQRLGEGFAPQGEVRGGYFRMLKVARMWWAIRPFCAARHLVSVLAFRLLGRRSKGKIGQSYLHLITGLVIFGSPVDHAIRKFYKLHISSKSS